VIVGARSFDEMQRLARDRAVRGLLVGSHRLRDQWHRLRADDPGLVDVPVIVCSLRTTHFGVEALPVSDYLIKPITSDKLHASLRRLHRRLGRILVTEDDPDMSRLLVRWVRAYARGGEVVAACDGEECWRMIQERAPDLLLLDLLMPHLNGYEVLERIRSDERLRDLPTIVITARGDQEEHVTVSLLQIDHAPGLPVGVAMRCLKANLDYLKNVTEGRAATLQGATRG
jgi:CheY-like chemotaxis protein